MSRSNSGAFPVQAFRQIGLITFFGVLACLLISLAFNYALGFADDLTVLQYGLASAVALPLLIGAPLSFLLGLERRRTAVLRRQLQASATYDHLTHVYHGNVFSSSIDNRRRSTAGTHEGALLVVNADNLSAIVAERGFYSGEETLQMLASVLRESIRSGDTIGRLGESVFGVFLPGAGEKDARGVGERIRSRVAEVIHAPTEGASAHAELLEISVGGVFFEEPEGFEELYRPAAQQLAIAQMSGDVELLHYQKPAGGTLH